MAKVTPLNNTPSAVKDGVLGGGCCYEFLGMVRAAAKAREQRLTMIRDHGQRTTQIAIGEQRLTTIRDQGQRTTQIVIGEQRVATISNHK
jgi:hypothetical protein